MARATAHTKRITSCRWRQQVEITRHGPDVSQALEKQSHWQLRLTSQVTEPDAFAWLRFVANQVSRRVCHRAVKRSLVGSSYGASLNAPCRHLNFRSAALNGAQSSW